MKKLFKQLNIISLLMTFVVSMTLFVRLAQATEVFTDTFNEVSDTALDAHDPDLGEGWTIIIQNGGGQLRADVPADNLDVLSGGNGDGVLYTADITGGYPTSDYEVTIDTVNGDTADDYNYLGLRIQDASNMYIARFNESGGQLYKRTTAGGWATIGASFAAVVDGSTVTFRVIGDTLTFYDDGVLRRTVVDTDITAAGKAGVGMGDIGINTGNDLSAQTLDNFGVNPIVTISGTAFKEDRSGLLGSGRTISVSINGGADAGSAMTDGSSNFTIPGLFIDAGDVVTVYIDDDGDDAVAVTIADGLDMDIDLYKKHLIVRNDNGGATTNANLNTANNVGEPADIDTIYTMSGDELTMAANDIVLYIQDGQEYAPGDFVQAYDLLIQGTFTMANSAIFVDQTFDATGGQFSSTGTITFNGGSGTESLISDGSSFNNIKFNASGSSKWELGDALILTGTLGITDGELDVTSFNYPVTVGGNYYNLDKFTQRLGLVTFSGTGLHTIESGTGSFYQLTFNGIGGTWTLQDDLTALSDLTITNGNLDANASGDYSILAGGDWTNNDIFTARNGLVTFDDGDPHSITSGGDSFYNMTLNDGGGTWTLQDDLDVNGTLHISAGDLDVNTTSNYTINLAGNWINDDGFFARNGEVILDGDDQSVLNSTTFYKLTKEETTNNGSSVTLTFDDGKTTTVLDTLTITGLDSDDLINWVSDNPGSRADIDAQGGRIIKFLDVIDSENVSGVTMDCTNGCVDSLNNIDWNFTAVMITITGTVYIDEGVTNIGSGKTVALSINGGAIDATDDTDANGAYSITTVGNVGASSVLTLFLDNETENAVTVTIGDGGNMSNIDLYQDYLITRNDALGVITTVNLDTANNVADGDVDAIYSIPSTNKLRTANGVELLVPLGHEYAPNAGVEIGTSGTTSILDIDGTLTMSTTGTLEVEGTMDVAGAFVGAAGYLDINGTLNVSAGSFTSTSGTLSVSGTMDLASASYIHNSGTLSLDGITQQTASLGSNTFNTIAVSNATGPGVIFTEAFTTQDFVNITPNSSMTFQQSTTFTFTGVMTLTGASGMQINLDSVDSATRFTWSFTTQSQSVDYINVGNSEIITNNIEAFDSSEGLNTDAAEAAPHWIFQDPAEISVFTGRFTMTSGTGNLAITGVGFTPKAYILFLTKNDSDDMNSAEGTGLGSQLSIGMTDGTRQFCMTSGVEDNQTSSDVGRRGFETAQGSEVGNRVACNIDVGSGSQDVRGEASHVSFDADGFTINRDVTFTEPTNVLVEYVVFGGADMNAYVNLVNLNDTLDASINETAPGFEPDMVITSYTGKYLDANGNGDNDDESISFGWAVNPAIQASNNQYSITKTSRDGQSTATGETRFDDARAGVAIRDGVQDASFEIENFDGSGFDVTTRLAASGDNEIMGYLALELGTSPQVFTTARPAKTVTTGFDTEEDARFRPIFLMGIGGAVATTANTNTSGASLTIGITDGLTEYTMFLHDEDSVTTTNTHSRTTSTQFMSAFEDGGMIDWQSQLESFDINGWTIDYTKKASTDYLNAFLAIGRSPAPVTITGKVYSDEGVTPIGSGTTVTITTNGGIERQTTTTDGAGTYTFTLTTDEDDVITMFIDDETEKGVLVTVADGNALSGLDLYQNRLMIRHDNGGTLTITNLDLADDIGDTDVSAVYSVLGGKLTVEDGYELFLVSGNTFIPGGEVITDGIDINGTLTLGTNLLTVSGTFDATGGTFTSTGNVLFDAMTSVTGTFGSNAFNDVTFNGVGGTWIIEDALDVNGDLTITNGALDANTAEDNTVKIAGDWSVSGNFLARAGQVIFDATAGTPTITSGSNSFYDVLFDDGENNITHILQDNLDVDNALTISDGNLDVNSVGNYNINIAGDWTNDDMFTARNGLVTLDGGDQSFVGSTTFYNLTKLETTNDSTDVTVTFDTTGSLAILNTWTFTGLDSDDQIIIEPDVALTPWYINPQGARAISYLDVTYSNNVSGTTVSCTNGCTDSTNNIDWNFMAATITVSGTVYIDEGSTDIGAGTTVRLAVNGVSDNSDTTDANGGYSITSGVLVGNGAVITLYLDTNGGDSGVTVALSTGSDATDMDIYRDYLILRADNGGSVTNANLDTANNNGDTDIDAIYTMSGTDLTLVNGNELFVEASKAYTPSGDVTIGTSGSTTSIDINGTMTMMAGETLIVRGTLDLAGDFTGSGATIDVDGDVMVTAGTFNAPSTTMTVSGTASFTAGSFVHNSGIVDFDGAQQQTISAANNTFNEIIVSNSATSTVFFNEAFTTANFSNTTVGSRMSFQQSTTFTITNNLTLNGSSGNEIRLNSIDNATRFTFDVTGGSQSVLNVDVANTQASSNNIIANNSIEGSNTDSAEAAPHWVFPTPTAINIATGRFTITAGTGNLSVTGVGFQPSAYIIILTRNDTDDTNSVEGENNGSRISVGMTDGTRQFCMGSGVEDNQTTSDTGRRGYSDEVVCNSQIYDGSQAERGEANHVSFDADGFTINRAVTFTEPTSVLAQYIAFGGADLNVRVDTVDLNNSVDADVDETAPGFEPDLVFTSFIGHFLDSDNDGDNDDHSFSFGWAVNPSVQSTENQYSIMTASRDLQATGQTVTRFDDTRAGTSYRDGGIDASYEINTFDANGFTVTTRLATATTDELMGYMAVELGTSPLIYSTASTASTTTGNEVVTAPRFEPILLVGIGSAVSTTANSNTAGGSAVIGITDGTDTLSMAIHDENGAAVSNTHSRTTNTQFMSAPANDGVIDWEANFSSFDTNGWTLNYGDAAPSAYNVAYLAYGIVPAPATIAGTVYTNEGVTNIGAGKTVALSINGASAIQTSETDVNGEFEFTIDTNANDVVTVYLEDETENAVTVTVSDGNLLSAFDLYQDYLIIRNDNTSATSNANLAVADDNGDADITAIYTMAGNVLTVPDGVELLVNASQTYIPGNDVIAEDVDINGNFTMGGNAITISGSFDATGGMFTSTGTVLFDATVSRTITSNNNAFNNIEFNGTAGTWVLEDGLDVNDTLLITTGTLDINVSENNSVNVGLSWINNGTFIGHNGTVIFDGTSSGSITSNSGTFYNVEFNGAGGTWLLEDALDVEGSLSLAQGTLDANLTEDNSINLAGNWVNSGGTLQARSATVTFDAIMGSPTITTGLSAFNHVDFNDAGNNITFTLLDALDADGNLRITGGSLDVNAAGNYMVYAGGLWTNNDIFIPRTSTVVFNAAAGINDIVPGGIAFYNVEFNDSGGGGTYELEETLDVNGTLTLTSGILDVKLTEDNLIRVAGNWTRTSGTFTSRNGTVLFDAIAGSPTITSNTQMFNNIDFDDTGNGITFTLQDALDVDGTLRINGGTLDANSGNINIAGSWYNNDIFTPSTSSVIFDATVGAVTINNGASAFYDFQINDVANNIDFVLNSTLDVNNNVLLISGTLDTDVSQNNLIRVAGSWTSADTFLARTSTVIFDATAGSPIVNSIGQSFFNVDFDDTGNGITFTLEDNLDVNGTLRINGGTLDTNASENNDINVASDWINNDMFLAQSAEVVLDGGDQSFIGSTTFYDLTKNDISDNTDVTVTFDVTGSLGITNIWTFNGIDAVDDRIILQPSVALTDWYINPTGIRAISFLNPTYSVNVDATTIQCTNGCTDGTNNVNWNFIAGVITVTGTVYGDEGVTGIGAGITVQMDVNGVADNSDVTDAGGGFTINSGVVVGNGAVVTLYLDTGGGAQGVTVLISDGNNVSDIEIYQDYLITRADNGSFVNNINLNTANNSGDTDIDGIYTMAANVVTIVNGKELFVPANKEYRPGDDLIIGSSGATTTLDINGTLTMQAGETLTVRGTLDSAGEFAGSSATVDINGTLFISAGDFTAPSTTMTVSGTVDLATGTYIHNSGIMTLDGAQQQTISAGANTFNEITVMNGSSSTVFFDEAFTTATFRNTTVASRMSFQQSTTFTITSNLILNGSSGNEIRLNSIDESTRFTLDVTGGSQTVSFVDVSNSQASSNNITANNSINTINTDSAEAAPQWIFVTQPNLLIDTGRFTLTAGTGNLAITGVGFQPSAYILFLTKNAVDDTDSVGGVDNGGLLSVGMTDGTRQFCMASGAEDDQTTSDVGRRGFSDEVVCNIDVGDDTQTILGEANHVSFDADGFTINRAVAFTEPTSVLVEYIAFGGSDLSVYVDTVDLNNTQDASVDVTSPGFEPDLIMTSFIAKMIDGNGNTNNDDHAFSFGWAVNPTVQSTNNQYSMMTASRDNVGTTETTTRFDDTRAGTSYRDGAIDTSVQIQNFDASGFDVTTRLAAAEVNEFMGYLALNVTGTPYIYSGSRTTPTSAGSDKEGNTRFEPIFLMGMSSAVATSANTDTDGGSMTIGMADGTDSHTISFHDEDNVGTSNAHSRTTSTQFMLGYADDGTVDWEASLTSFDESGWTLNYGNAASTNYQAGFLAIGLNAAATTISGKVYSDEGVTAVGAGTTVSLSINGERVVQSSDTDASGDYDFTVDPANADILSIFIDDEANRGLLVAPTDGNLNTNMDIYHRYLILRHENAGPITNANLATADGSGDADMTSIYTMSTNQLTVAGTVETLIQAGDTFTPGDTVSVYDLDINGNFLMAANAVTVSGSIDATVGFFNSTGTLTMTASSGVVDIISNGSAFENLIISVGGTVRMEDALDIDGTLRLSSGWLDVNVSESNPITIAGNWRNAGGFLSGRSGTVTFNGVNQSVFGSTTFNSFVKIDTNNNTDRVLTFEAGTTTSIMGTLDLEGFDTDDRINLVSSIPGTRYSINAVNMVQSTSFVDVSDAEALGNDITASDSLDTTNNDSGEGTPEWVFANFITATGSTNLGDGVTIAIAINNVLSGSTAMTSGGIWTIMNIAPNMNDIITVWADSVAENIETTSISKYDGTGNITGIILQTGTLSIGNGDDQSIAMTDLGQYDNSNSEDILYILTVGNTLQTSQSRVGLLIDSGDTFQTLGYNMDINGTIDINGVLDATNGVGGNTTIDAGGTWEATGGTFTNTNSTVVFTGTTATQTFDIISAGDAFNNIKFDDNAGDTTWELEDPITVNGTFFLADGILDTNAAENNNITSTGTFYIAGGNLTANASTITAANSFGIANIAGLFTAGTSTVHLTGTGTLGSSHANNTIYHLIVAEGGQTTTLTEDVQVRTLDIRGGLLTTDSNVDMVIRTAPTATTILTMNAGATVDLSGGGSNLEFGIRGSTETYTIEGGNYVGATIAPRFTGAGTVQLITRDIMVDRIDFQNAANDATFDFNDFNANIYNQIDFSAADAPSVLMGTGSIDIDGATSILVDAGVTNATIDLEGATVFLAGDISDAGSKMQFIGGTSTLVFDRTSGTQTLDTSAILHTVVIDDPDGGGDLSVDLAGNMVVTGSIVLIDSTFDVTASNYNISLGGNWVNSGGTFVARNGTVIFTGTTSDQTIAQGTDVFYNLQMNNTAPAGDDDIILMQYLDINGSLTLTDGDLNVGTSTITIAGNWVTTATGTFTPGTSTVAFDRASGTQIISGSASFYNLEINDPNGGGDLTIQPAGTLDINGTFLLTDGNFDLATNDPAFFVYGNFTLVSGSYTPGLSTATWDGVKTFTDNIMTNVGTILITPDTTLASDFSGASLTIAAGDTYITDGYEVDLSQNMTVNGTLDARSGTDGNSIINIGRNWSSGSGLLLMQSSTVIFDDNAGTNTITLGASNSFYNVVFEDGNGGSNVSWNLQDALDVEGTLWIIDGDLDVSASNYQVNVAGNWINNDEFDDRSGTVVFDGTASQTITTCNGCLAGDFTNIQILNASASTLFFQDSFSVGGFTATLPDTQLNFEAGTTVTITTLTLDGGAAENKIFLNSSDFTTRFTLDVATEQNVSFVNVSNSQASTSNIRTRNSIAGPNTDKNESDPRWIFGLKGAIIIVD